MPEVATALEPQNQSQQRHHFVTSKVLIYFLDRTWQNKEICTTSNGRTGGSLLVTLVSMLCAIQWCVNFIILKAKSPN